MLARNLLTRSLARSLLSTHRIQRLPVRCITTEPENKSWLTRKVEESPATKKWFLRFTKLLGYGSSKQLAGRRAFVVYERIITVAPEQYPDFWKNECHLPPTFQSWFTITNLHIWMLTVRLRALPQEHGRHYIQALIDHFFIDVEDRIRAVLQPPLKPTKSYTPISSFYINPNASKPSDEDSSSSSSPSKPKGRAPDRIVNRQMKIFKEQWAGMGLSFDLALVKGDMEMAGAVWRNLLGARGARGIAYPTTTDGQSNQFRRAVNLVGGEVVNVSKIDMEKEETRDDGSGVHDFPPAEIDKYVQYPEVMLDIVGYVRRELARLEKISDHDIMSGDWEKLRFGPIKSTGS